MAQLTEQQRAEIWAKIMQVFSADNDAVGSMSKQDLRNAVDAIDTWIDDNTNNFNVSIPQPTRNALTAKQKSRILMLIVGKRWEVS